MQNNWKLEERAKKLADVCEGRVEEIINELIDEVEMLETTIEKKEKEHEREVEILNDKIEELELKINE